MSTATRDKMQVLVCDSMLEVGAAAAGDLAEILGTTLAECDQAAVILATGNSQLSFFQALRERTDVAWEKLAIFHLDEYVGMSDQHPASFRRYIRRQLTDIVHPRVFHEIAGDAPDLEGELARYAALLQEESPVACVLGIGENGHLAFNDPPVDFCHPESIQLVTLSEASRRQQVGEGHFATLDDVPQRAITLTVPTLLRPAHVLAVVPEARKAHAVKAALQGPVTPDWPASILRTQPHVKLYLDRDSAALLT